MKATNCKDARLLEQIPNIGKAMAADLRRLGYEEPTALCGQDPYAIYEKLCAETGVRQDPCVLDTFIAAVRFMDGGPTLPWWSFTPERKKALLESIKP